MAFILKPFPLNSLCGAFKVHLGLFTFIDQVPFDQTKENGGGQSHK